MIRDKGGVGENLYMNARVYYLISPVGKLLDCVNPP